MLSMSSVRAAGGPVSKEHLGTLGTFRVGIVTKLTVLTALGKTPVKSILR